MIKPTPRPKACPNCRSMYLRPHDIAWDWIWEREDHHEILTWQCVNCGAVIWKTIYKLEVVRFDSIRLAPGELQELRVTVEGQEIRR